MTNIISELIGGLKPYQLKVLSNVLGTENSTPALVNHFASNPEDLYIIT